VKPGAVSPNDQRVLALVPTAKDSSITHSLLSGAGIAVTLLNSFDSLLDALGDGAAAILIPEEVLISPKSQRLRDYLDAQPQWSDLPVLVLARPGADSAASGDAVRTLGNVTLLERPLQVTTLLSAVRTSLRARDRQYQIRYHLEERARAEESLRLADQRKDEFLATLGHELRNPLAPLLIGVEILKAARIADPRVLQMTTVMERQIQHLVRLVDDLLEVSRITRGLIQIQREPLDLATILQSAIDTSRPIVEGAGHHLTIDMAGSDSPDGAIVVSGDVVRLTQVFANLLTNAAKYTNTGGHITLTMRRLNGTARVSVRDTGIGIPETHLNSIFDMFMQVDRSNRRAQGGLGIGLTLVRSLVEMHGGRVEAKSDGPGKGSEFIVELPVVHANASRAKTPVALGTLPPRRVLVVDDNVDAAATLGTLLKALGATVSVVNGGQSALDAAATFHPDTVLLDIGMPDMDGYEVARRLRESPETAGVQLIALTGWGQDADQMQSRAAGFDHHLVKPPNMRQLSALLGAQQTMS
jgi:signal transduction histidine kinase/ActR/RegA family two-component response regulator